MVFIHTATRQMVAKIVYYGPGLSGKTTNLEWIYRHTHPRSRGEMVSLETEADRTLFFDLLPLEVGMISGFRTRFQLYTVPGQVFYNSTRKLVLRGVDGLVFVADSQRPMMEANIESLQNMRDNLRALEIDPDTVPLVFQYNKRDLHNVEDVETLNRVLNPRQFPYFEAIAIQGVGVFETLKAIAKLTLVSVRKRLEEHTQTARTTVPLRPSPSHSQTPSPKFIPPPPEPSTGSAGAGALSLSPQASPALTPAALVQEAERERVEFAPAESTASTETFVVKKVAVPSITDIEKELERLRAAALSRPSPEGGAQRRHVRDATDRLEELIQNAVLPRPVPTVKKQVKIRLHPSDIAQFRDLWIDLELHGSETSKRFTRVLKVAIPDQRGQRKVRLILELELIPKPGDGRRDASQDHREE